MSVHAAIAPPLDAAALEAWLGDPRDAENPFGWAAALRAEAAGDPRDAQAEALRQAGLHAAMIPASWQAGGTLTDLGALMTLARRITARDAALMPRTMFSIGPLCVLEMAGRPDQRAEAARRVLAGRDIAFALSEPESRSDLAGGSFRATRGADGWRLSGRKWLIGRAGAADAVLTLAKTGEGGPAASTLFMTPPGARIAATPRARLSGMCGIDVADLIYDEAPAGDPVGPVGRGLELAFRAQGPVKALSVAAALGPMETTLRLAHEAAGDHTHQRMVLGEALADYLTVDALATAAMRLLATAPKQFSLIASVTKALAVETAPRVFAACAQVLGARSVLRDDPAGAVLDKMRRDAGIVRVIDINEIANLRSIATQLDALLSRRTGADPAARWEAMRAALELSAPARSDLARTQVVNMGGDRLVEALPAICAALVGDTRFAGPAGEASRTALGALAADLDALQDDLVALRARFPKEYATRPELIRAASRYGRIHAGAALAALMLANPEGVGPGFACGGWAALALHRLAFGERAEPAADLWEAAWILLQNCLDGRIAPAMTRMPCR